MSKLLFLSLSLGTLFHRHIEATIATTIQLKDSTKPTTCLYHNGDEHYEFQINNEGTVLKNCSKVVCRARNETHMELTTTPQKTYGSLNGTGCTLVNDKEIPYPFCEDEELSCTGEMPTPIGSDLGQEHSGGTRPSSLLIISPLYFLFLLYLIN